MCQNRLMVGTSTNIQIGESQMWQLGFGRIVTKNA
jgi:hypothetical protein